MENKLKRKRVLTVAAVVVVAVLVVSVVAGLILYYSNEIANLNSQVENLNGHLHDPYIVTSLGSAVLNNFTYSSNGVNVTSIALNLAGTITNTGRGEAYNVGLYVDATDASGATVINVTIPVNYNSTLENSTSKSFSYIPTVILSGENLNLSNSTLGITQEYYCDYAIPCNAAPVNWTITPVCTNFP